MTVLNTNVISEAAKPDPSAIVAGWMADQPDRDLFTTSITQAKLLFGIELVPQGRRRDLLQKAIVGILYEDLADQILPFGSASAPFYAEIATPATSRTAASRLSTLGKANQDPIQHRQREHRTIHTIQQPAMTGQQCPAIFHTGSTLDRRFRQIPDLPGDIRRQRQQQRFTYPNSGNQSRQRQPSRDA